MRSDSGLLQQAAYSFADVAAGMPRALPVPAEITAPPRVNPTFASIISPFDEWNPATASRSFQ
jgi:hypothetical protein